MECITSEIVERVIKLTVAVLDFNKHYMDSRMTLKIYQNRIELVTYRNAISNGILYDAEFKSFDHESFEKDLKKIEEAVENMNKWYNTKKED